MKLSHQYCVVLVLLLAPLTGYSQLNDVDDYATEFIWGVNKNTSGGLIGGFIVRGSRRVSDKLYQSVGVEVMNVKHPQESRMLSGIGNFFIYGKSNYLYTVRAQYGREYVLFRKAPQQGVEIKAVGAIGPSFGLLAPYYIEYDAGGGSDGINPRREQYDPAKHLSERILGTGRLFQGLFESKIRVGANVKGALSFELGALKTNVTGIELGFLVDAYTQKIELMPLAENKAIFPTAFITLYYGKRR